VVPLARMPFLVWARATGDDGLKLTDDEAKSLACALAPVLGKYLPKFGSFQEEMTFLLVLSATVGIVKARAKKKTNDDDSSSTAGQ
jgi:hypothetical protein